MANWGPRTECRWSQRAPKSIAWRPSTCICVDRWSGEESLWQHTPGGRFSQRWIFRLAAWYWALLRCRCLRRLGLLVPQEEATEVSALHKFVRQLRRLQDATFANWGFLGKASHHLEEKGKLSGVKVSEATAKWALLEALRYCCYALWSWTSKWVGDFSMTSQIRSVWFPSWRMIG